MADNYIQITVSNYFNVACGTCAPGYFNVNTYQISDDFQMKGQAPDRVRHRRPQGAVQHPNNQQSNGQWTFQRRQHQRLLRRQSLADVELGKLARLTDGNALSDYMRQTVFAAYVQDTSAPRRI